MTMDKVTREALKQSHIKTAKALSLAYGVALVYDMEIGNPGLHNEIEELLHFFLKEKGLTVKDLAEGNVIEI